MAYKLEENEDAVPRHESWAAHLVSEIGTLSSSGREAEAAQNGTCPAPQDLTLLYLGKPGA